VIRLRGRTTNRDALGARVTVTPLGDPAGSDGVAGFAQVQTLYSGQSYVSQNAADLYFGLAGNTSARVEILWPGGETQTIESVAADQLVLVRQGDAPRSKDLQPTAGSDLP